MSQKTFDKLKAICEPHGVEVDGYRESGEWNLVFNAPEKMNWCTSQAGVVNYYGALRGAVSFIRSELDCGFEKGETE